MLRGEFLFFNMIVIGSFVLIKECVGNYYSIMNDYDNLVRVFFV